MTMALLAVACGSDAQPAAPAPTLDIAAIQAAVKGAIPEQLSAAEIQELVKAATAEGVSKA